MAVRAMQSMGWTAQRKTDRKHPRWVFTRPDTGGLWDSLSIAQGDLTMVWVANMAMTYGDAPDLCAEIDTAKHRWIQMRFRGLTAEFEVNA